jgi:thiosulfate dehydrogenase
MLNSPSTRRRALLGGTLLWCAAVAFVPAAPITASAPGDPVRGLALMTAFRDSLPAHSGNRLRCVSCHLDNGTRATAMPWLGTANRYPRYRARPGYEETLARRINECIARSLAGKMVREDGRDMRDMIAYIESLRDSPRPATADSVLVAGVPMHGQREYAATCARCHGNQGQGTPIAPAVWGVDSYSIGAGLARQFTLATFLRHNMPFDHVITLSERQAADIAAYVLARPRQDHPLKERDWPKGDPPADVAYATDAARAAGKPLPKPRPLLRRRVKPDSLTSH